MIEFRRHWRVYAATDGRGISVIEAWAKEIKRDKDLLARLNQKLDLLERNGSDLPTGLLAGTKLRHIDKLKIFGKKQTWRIMICKGPILNEFEFTMLFAAQEKDRKLIPPDAYQRADAMRQAILQDPTRRKLHERIS